MMKLENSFLGRLLPFGKRHPISEILNYRKKNRQSLFALLLVLLWLLVFVLVTLRSPAQPAPFGNGIGQKLPDISMGQLINYSSPSAKLSDFKGKLLILDFWATYCTPCIKSLPEFEQLQKRFDGEVQFLLVTAENTDKAKAFLDKHHCSLPSVTGDTILNRLFKHTYIPHEVWIKDGVIIAVTQPWVVTAGNLEKVVRNQPVRLPSKNDQLSFDSHKPFLLNGNGGEGNNILYHSILTAFTDGLPSRRSFSRDSSGKVTRLCMTNAGITTLYQEAFSELDPGLKYNNRLVIDVADSLKPYFYNDQQLNRQQWLATYGFCFEIIAARHLYPSMRDDLNRFFWNELQVNAFVRKQPVDCWVISRLPEMQVTSSAGTNPSVAATSTGYVMTNLPFTFFLNNLMEKNQGSCPILSDTVLSGNIDLTINGGLEDMGAVKAGLNRIGLDINKVRKNIDMLVITDQRDGNYNTQLKP